MWQNNFRCQYFAKISNVSRKAGWIKCWTSVLFGQRLNCSTASSPALPYVTDLFLLLVFITGLLSCPVLSCRLVFAPFSENIANVAFKSKSALNRACFYFWEMSVFTQVVYTGCVNDFSIPNPCSFSKKNNNLVPSLASRCLNDFVGENSDFKHNGYNQYCLKAIQKSPASIVYFNIRRTVWCVNCVSSLY